MRKTDAPPELTELAARYLEEEEVVWSWEHKGKHSVARLIDRKRVDACEESARRFGRSGGRGRTLEFFRRDGEWELVSKGGWVS
jgi:hypothetical protein